MIAVEVGVTVVFTAPLAGFSAYNVVEEVVTVGKVSFPTNI